MLEKGRKMVLDKKKAFLKAFISIERFKALVT